MTQSPSLQAGWAQVVMPRNGARFVVGFVAIEGLKVREIGPITLIQTASGPVYEAMLSATASLHRAYCDAHGLEFWSFVGVRRGFHPWQASFNRIEMIHDLVERGYRGWVLYLDADAVIRQQDFDVRRFLGKRHEHSLIASSGGVERWAINDGVFFVDLSKEAGREIIKRWRSEFHAIPLELLKASAEPWQALEDGRNFPDDQHLLQMVLAKDNQLLNSLLLEDPKTINHRGARFIRQFLRSHGSLAERLVWIRDVVDSCRDGAGSAEQS